MKVKLLNENFSSDYAANLLRARGIEDVEAFLKAEDALQSWEDLKSMKVAAAALHAVPINGRIGLVVDCDCDGYTSAAIIHQYIRLVRADIEIHPYIHTGKAHGLEEHWEDIQAQNFDLVIVPDAGSNDGEYAVEIEADIVVIDHHLVEPDKQSTNMIIVNNQDSPDYRNKNLSGAGMALQFCRAYDDLYLHDYSRRFWDLAALGVCGDMMSGLEIENQYIWRRGFKSVTNPFFMALADKQSYSITGKMTPTNSDIINALNPTSVAFYIVPLINALIRIGTQDEKERMYLAFVDGYYKVPSQKRGAKGTMVAVAEESTRECVNARTHQNKIKDDAVFSLEQKIFKYDLLENKILFITLDEDDNFPSELNGLIAMQLSQKYKKPTILARLNPEGMVRGSIRGLSNSPLTSFKEYLDETGLCEYVQGHDNAAGISIAYANVETLLKRSNKDFQQIDFGENVYEVNFIRQALANDLSKLIIDLANFKNIWSQQNPEPMIYVTDLHFLRSEIQIMGKNRDTLKIVKNGVAYMKFFAKDLIAQIEEMPEPELKMEVVGRANLNEWLGKFTAQIFIEDYTLKIDSKLDF